jgi:hypothetical protein
MDSSAEELDVSAVSNSKVNQGGQAKKPRTVTFQVDSRIVDWPQRGADNNGVSLNI